MGVLSDSDLRALRGVQTENFPHRGKLQAETEIELPTGGRVTTWVTYATDVPCRLSPISGTELPRGLVLTPETNYRVTFPYGQPVAPKDRVVVTGLTDGIEWTQTIGFTFIDTPKAFASSTPAYGTDQVAQVGEG